jgi:hypothetical protein
MSLESRVTKIEEKVGAGKQEIPPKDRTQVVPFTEGKERRIEEIKAELFKKYGTTKGAIFFVTRCIGPWDEEADPR